MLNKYAVMARMSNPNLIPEITSCHQLRHSRAIHLLQSGVNLVWKRDLLGHSSVQTTEIYARADSKLLSITDRVYSQQYTSGIASVPLLFVLISELNN
jgi:site-specific recombinase XerD